MEKPPSDIKIGTIHLNVRDPLFVTWFDEFGLTHTGQGDILS